MRRIDGDALKRVLNIKPEDWNTPDERWRPESEFGKAIDAMPTIEAEPIKHGRWIRCDNVYSDGDYECSECHKREWSDTDYCPNCGARMDGGENG